MKIILSTGGTQGDLNPFLYLGEALRDKGAEILFALNPFDKSKAEKRGFEVITSGESFDVDEFIRNNTDIATLKGAPKIWRQGYLPRQKQMYEDITKAIHSFRPDAVVSHPLCIGSQWAALDANIKHVIICLQPMPVFSVSDPSIISLNDPLKFTEPALLKKVLSIITILRSFVVKKFMDHGLKKVASDIGIEYKGHLFSDMFSRADLILGLWSGDFRGYADDDPKNLKISGFPFPVKSSDRELSDEVSAFLKENPSPVIVAMGTSARNIASDVYDKISQACDDLNKPCILVGCTDPSITEKYTKIMTTPFEPYDKLFPSASLIVHHAGMGTCANVFKSGKPSVIIPFFADQFDNALRAERIGVAAKALSRSKLTVVKLRSAIQNTLNSSETREKAEKLAEKLRTAVNGAVAGADEILRLVE